MPKTSKSKLNEAGLTIPGNPLAGEQIPDEAEDADWSEDPNVKTPQISDTTDSTDSIPGDGGEVSKMVAKIAKQPNGKKASVDGPEDVGPDIPDEVPSGDVSIESDLSALFSGETLSEEFQGKAKVIFEAAVKGAIKAEGNRLKELYDTAFVQAKKENHDLLAESVDGYLNYTVEQWMEENKLAVESGIRVEQAESLMTGLKTLLDAHYVEVPKDKIDLVKDSQEKAAKLQKDLDEAIERTVELQKRVREFEREEVIGKFCEGLTDTQTDKLRTLAEELSFESAEQYSEKVKTLRESYFTKHAKRGADITSSTLTESDEESGVDLSAVSPEIAEVSRRLSRFASTQPAQPTKTNK